MMGLTSGLRLAQRGHEVVILKRGTVPGGLAASFEIESGIRLERFLHHLFRSDGSAIDVIEEVGLGDRLMRSRPETTLAVDGRPYQLDGAYLGFIEAGVTDRLRPGRARHGHRPGRTVTDRPAGNGTRSVPTARQLAPSTTPADRERMLEPYPALRAAAEAWARRGGPEKQ